MNCKQGDLAVIVRSDAGNAGKIVRCLRLVGNQLWVDLYGRRVSCATWEVDRELVGWGGDRFNLISDDQLRPLRDPGEDAKDETLQWKEVPTKQKEPA
jgi:hypothetical protein